MEAIATATGLSVESLQEPTTPVDLETRCRIYEVCMELSADPYLGIRVGASTSPLILGLAGHLMVSSADMRSVYENLAKFSMTFSRQITFRTAVKDNTFQFFVDPVAIWEESSPGTVRTGVDIIFASALFVARLLSGKSIQPVSVHYRYPRPADEIVFQEILKVRPNWNASDNVIRFRMEDMALPVFGHNPELNAQFKAQLEEQLAGQTSTGSLTDRVRQVILKHYQFILPSIAEVSSHLNLSPRTLQRKLAEEGTTFQRIADAVRRELALRLMSRTRLTVAEVAYKLGYQDPTAFQRAFRNWTGTTPLAHRTAAHQR